MKVLVTGHSGMLGKDIVGILCRDFNIDLFGIDKKLDKNLNNGNQYIGDLLNPSFVHETLNVIKPDVIIHCAAIVNLTLCEENKELTHSLHVDVTDWLSSYNLKKFIYISTDSVFDGKKGNYTEEDKPNPLNFYARSKLEGENIALKNNVNTVICRTNIYGFKKPIGNSLTEWALNNLSKGNSIKGFTDIIFNPLYTKQLAKLIKQIIIQHNYRGILNIVSHTPISKYNFLIKLANEFDIKTSLIEKSNSDELNFKVSRPKNTTLNCSKLKKLFGLTYLLEDGLKQFKQNYNKMK